MQDDVKSRVDKIIKDIEQTEKEKAKISETSFAGKTKSNVASITYLWSQLLLSGQYAWKTFFAPFILFFHWVAIRVAWNNWIKLWYKFAYETVDGTKVFSKRRGAYTIVGTVFVAWFAISIMSFVWNTVLYVTTARVDEVVYLSNAQEIAPEDNIFSVQGCETPQAGKNFSCSEDESLYFRINPSEFAQVWSILTRGSFFYPDYIAAPIAPGWQKCVITSYGFRMKTMIRSWEIYPTLLSARCEEM